MEFTFTSTTSKETGGAQTGGPSHVFTFGSTLPQPSEAFHSSASTPQHVFAPPTPPNLVRPASTPSSFGLPQHQLYSQSPFQPQDDAESRQLNPGNRMTLQQERGVGDSRRWRNRLWNQIENRIKDTRASLQNARRQGLLARDASAENSHVDNNQSSNTVDNLVPQLSEEEEQKIIAEEWEKFKTEHAAALLAELKGLSDREIEEFEQEMLQQRGDYDPSYDMLLEQEQDEIQDAIEEYLRHQGVPTTSLGEAGNQSLSVEDQVVALLTERNCFRCLSAPFQPSSAAQQEQHLSRKADKGSRPESTAKVQEVTCTACGYCLGGDAVQYIANVAQNHSQSCTGNLAFSFDDDTGLLITCNACDLLA